VRLAKFGSWQIRSTAEDPDLIFALWLRDIEAIEVPRSPLVPGLLDMGDLPPSLGEAHDPRLGEEWLAWWTSLVGRHPRKLPPDDAEALHSYVTQRWTEFQDWRIAHRRTHSPFASRHPRSEHREHDVVRQVEATLGRKAARFSLTFTLLPVRDDRIRPVDATHYLVPERVYLGAGWPAWLRDVVAEVA